MITYIITVTIVRLSILLTLRRIFEVEPFKMITTIVGSASVAWGLSIFFANVFQCTPFMAAFDPDVVMSLSNKCINLQAMFYGTLGTAFILDLIILILPLHVIWRLRLPTRQKYELTAILSLGGLWVFPLIHEISVLGVIFPVKLSVSSHCELAEMLGELNS